MESGVRAEMLENAAIAASGLKTWEDVRCWGDVLDKKVKGIIRDVLTKTPEERLCPYLRKILEKGNAEWIYCQVQHDEIMKMRGLEVMADVVTDSEKTQLASPDDIRYQSCVDYAFLQLFCADNFEKCVDYGKADKK